MLIFATRSHDPGLEVKDRFSVRRTNPTLSIGGYALALVGLAGTTLSTLGQFAGTSLDLGLGGVERIATHPGTLWMVLIAIAVFTRAGADA